MTDNPGISADPHFRRDAPQSKPNGEPNGAPIDRDAFAEFVRRHNPMLFRVARAMVRDDAEAEDIVQATFVSAYSTLDSFRGGATLRTWLTRITINEVLTRRRRIGSLARLRNAAITLSEIGGSARHGAIVLSNSAADSPESAAARAEFRALLERAIDQLPEHFRAVFVLRAVEEFSVEDTAAALGIPRETVKSRHHRARRRLRRALNSELESALTGVFPFGGARCDRIVRRVLTAIGRL